jgi:hypothetical protein
MMAGNFALDIAKFVEKTKGRVDLVVTKMTLDVFNAVIMKTPVDTGRARANWRASVGKYSVFVDDDCDKTGQEAMAQVAAVIGPAKGGGISYLTNSLSYISVLEYGRASGKPGSIQAPNGMVRITCQEFQDYVQRAVNS